MFVFRACDQLSSMVKVVAVGHFFALWDWFLLNILISKSRLFLPAQAHTQRVLYCLPLGEWEWKGVQCIWRFRPGVMAACDLRWRFIARWGYRWRINGRMRFILDGATSSSCVARPSINHNSKVTRTSWRLKCRRPYSPDIDFSLCSSLKSWRAEYKWPNYFGTEWNYTHAFSIVSLEQMVVWSLHHRSTRFSI